MIDLLFMRRDYVALKDLLRGTNPPISWVYSTEMGQSGRMGASRQGG